MRVIGKNHQKIAKILKKTNLKKNLIGYIGNNLGNNYSHFNK